MREYKVKNQKRLKPLRNLLVFKSRQEFIFLTIVPLFEEQDSCWGEGDWSVHRHHSGGIWPEEALHFMLVS